MDAKRLGAGPEVGQKAHRANRLRKAFWSVAAGYLSRLLTIGVTLLSVPLALHYLNRERYGLWLLVASVMAYLGVSDLGLGSGLQNRVAEARGRNDKVAVGRLLSTACAATAILGLVVAGIGIIAIWALPIGAWFHVSSNLVPEFRRTLLVALLLLSLSLPLRMFSSAQAAYQEAYIASAWNAFGTAGSLAALLLVIALKGDLVALAVATFTLLQIAKAGNAWAFLRRHPEALPSWAGIRLPLLKSLFSLSWQFALMQGYTFILWNTDNIVIAGRLGSAAVVPYAVAFNLMWLFFNSLSFIPMNLWPAFSEASARGDWDWVESAFRRTALVTTSISALAGIGLFVWGRDVIRIWAGPGAVGSASLMAGLGLYIVIGNWASCNAILLNALSRPRATTVVGLFDAFLNLGLSIVLVRFWGPAGVAWGTTIGSLITSAWVLPLALGKVTEGRVLPPLKDAARVILPPALLVLPLALWLASRFNSPGLIRPGLLTGVPLTVLLFIAATWLFAPRELRLACGKGLRAARANLWIPA
jgi:O-antigen/teichoic acid export membrane protein